MTSDTTGQSGPRLAGGPAAWRASEIPQAGMSTYELTPSDVLELEAALRNVGTGDLALANIEKERFLLERLGNSLRAIRLQLEQGNGFCLIRGIPIERYSVAETEVLLCGIGAHLGRLMPQDSSGEVLGHVRATGSAAAPGEGARGYRDSVALPFHSDPCDIAGLLCISDAESGGLSAIASSHAVHDAMLAEYPDALQLLYQPFHIDRHGEGAQGDLRYYSTPVFMWHNNRLFSRFNPGYVYSAQRYPETPRLTTQQKNAMQIFYRLSASDRFRHNMKFKPGDLQLLNNNATVHARSSYQDCPGAGKMRHLLRLWLFTSGIDDIPRPMRDRYRDMEAWRVSLRLPEQPG